MEEPEQLDAAHPVDDGHVEQAVVRVDIRADVHAAAEPGRVGDGDHHRIVCGAAPSTVIVVGRRLSAGGSSTVATV